jgi:hypothetical protein
MWGLTDLGYLPRLFLPHADCAGRAIVIVRNIFDPALF